MKAVSNIDLQLVSGGDNEQGQTPPVQVHGGGNGDGWAVGVRVNVPITDNVVVSPSVGHVTGIGFVNPGVHVAVKW
ncbi:MAG: hypothetical protein U1E78_02405 [Gammaproteobacteria bacterium]